MTAIFSAYLHERPSEQGGGRLGRHIEHDPKSRDYALAAAPSKAVKEVLWKRWSPILDQGNLGSCTGNAITGLLGTEPFSTSAEQAGPYDEAFAVDMYSAATRLDPFPGHYRPDDTGSSGNAVAKAAKRDGLISRYQWAFSLGALITALQDGPVIGGAPWLSSFDRPDSNGEIALGGYIRGGHEWLIRGFDPAAGGMFFADNSWSAGWGLDGTFRFRPAVWTALAKMRADVTIPRR
jgi:hypothetical protein